ncbi:GNAT family N-acetyltransferase [Leptospira ryugenii]|nr:GNAT family N-acetyltransferase [Leptospira ryugenii]
MRPISEKDLSDLETWEMLCFPEDAWTKKMLLNHLEFHAAYLAFGERAQGYALICETPWEVEIFRIATLPNYHRLGVATFLLHSLFQEFPSKDFFLELRENNKTALNLYQKVGFGILETRKNYYPNGETAILMKRKPN